MLQAVDEDGITLQHGPVMLLDNNGITDMGSVEGPSLVRSGTNYVLFFSSGCFLTEAYTVNYATAPSITGPYTRASRPLFMTGDYGLSAPGGMSMHPDSKHMVFHAYFGSGRALYNAAIDISGGKVSEILGHSL